jgi:biopolymer transport protein ExbD
MSFIPDEALYGKESIPLAPMIDFVFIMLMFFASIAITRTALKDTHIDLVEASQESVLEENHNPDKENVIRISISDNGEYRWSSGSQELIAHSPEELAAMLSQHKPDNTNPQVLLKIDKNATWEPILKAIFVIRDAGFTVRPVYESLDTTRN